MIKLQLLLKMTKKCQRMTFSAKSWGCMFNNIDAVGFVHQALFWHFWRPFSQRDAFDGSCLVWICSTSRRPIKLISPSTLTPSHSKIKNVNVSETEARNISAASSASALKSVCELQVKGFTEVCLCGGRGCFRIKLLSSSFKQWRVLKEVWQKSLLSTAVSEHGLV